MSREDDEKELRKLEYLERRGVATFSDVRKRKELARKLAIEDFEKSEEVGKAIHDCAADRMAKQWGDKNPLAPKPPEKKGSTN